MSVRWKCDICGKDTLVHPPTELEYKEVETINKVTNKKEITKIPEMVKIKQQDLSSGKMKEIEVNKRRDLFPRTYIVKISIGPESIQKDFCLECLNKIKKPLIEVFEMLEKVESK